jgi:NAD(P)-dependent dehydrogenase (short-subunit alcohol dehydrogenase family)
MAFELTPARSLLSNELKTLNMPRFNGRRAIVTGASQGIGDAIARTLSAEGADVLLLDVKAEAGERAAEELRAAGGSARFRVCDVSASADVRAAAEDVRKTWGAVDFLVNNAGIFPRSSTCDMTVEEWQRVIGTNLGGAFHCVKYFAPLMVGPGAAVVNISSGRALAGAANGAAYAASKAGLLGFTKSLASEFAPRGIRVNALVPGITDTAQPRQEMDDADFARAALSIPLGRIGQPIDVARGVTFLLTGEAAYMTGQTLVINGGAIMR